MIKKLSIQNFQSHKETDLEFDPGVNIIIGSSDSGKTAIIRALRWLVWNRPSGESFRSHWGGDTSVELDLGDINISRTKGKQGVYKLGHELFKAFGAQVPMEIINALNLNEINLQQQLDSPFLLTASPGEAAKHFNKIAHLDQIDKGLNNIQKEIREISGSITFKEDLVIQYSKDLEEYAHLEKFEIEVETLEQMETTFIQKLKQQKQLDVLITSIELKFIQINEVSKILKIEKPVNSILSLYEQVKEQQQQKETLEYHIDHIERVGEKIKEYENLLQREPEIISLLEKYVIRKKKIKEGGKLDSFISDIQDLQMKQDRLEESLERYELEFDEAMPDVCPLCNQKIK